MSARLRAMACLMLLGLLLAHPAEAEMSIVDALGREVAFAEAPQRAVALLGSYGEIWLEAGGALAGTTEDAVDAPGARAQGGVANLGSHSEPNLERLFSLEPDFVILSADTAAHPAIGAMLESAGIPCGYFSVLDWRDYMDLLGAFTALTGREDLYREKVETVQRPIEAMIAAAQASDGYGERTVLLLRAYATSVRAKDSGSTVAGPILRDMGLVNLADSDSSLLENLTLEAVLAADPDYIFAVTMGADVEAAERMLAQTLLDNPAWSTLTAVREGRFAVLDRELFHYRPNGRWAEAYTLVQELLYAPR